MPPPNANHWKTDPEYIELVNYIIEQTRNVKSPMCIKILAIEFKETSRSAQTWKVLYDRIFSFRTKIHTFEHIDTNTKVRMMFALSTPVNADFLGKLKEDSFVKVDHKQRIIHYKSNDGSLELKGDHSHSARNKTGMLESNRSLRSIIINYFKNKNNADAVPKNRKEIEMGKLIEFIVEKCKTTDSPLSIRQLMKDFNDFFRLSKPTIFKDYFQRRIESYCYVIQKTEFLDTHSKVRQLFGLSATLDSNFLKELRKDADVEVDKLNRITKYAANDGRLTLHGDHSLKAKAKLGWIEWDKKRNAAKKHRNFGDDDGDDHSDDDSGEYYSEEFDSDDHNNHMDEVSETKKDDGENRKSNKNPKRKNACSTASASKKKRNKGTTGFISSNRVKSSSNDSMRPNELDDYDTNYSFEDQVKLEPFRGSIQENLNEIEVDEDIQQIPKPHQARDEQNQIEEVPIKEELKDPVEVKPETAHNSRIRFFEAMQSLIFCLDTPCLSWIQSKIDQKFQIVGGPNEVMLNDEIVLIIDLLIAQIIDNSVLNLSENVESMNISNFLCYLKAAIQNSRMSGMEGLMNNISELIEESQNKIIPLEKMANALLATLDDIQQTSKPHQVLDEHDRVEEVPIKLEHEESVDIKPEASHNSKIKFFEAMHSLILCLNTPSLSSIQSKIHQKIRELEKYDEVILNKGIILVVKPLIFRIINFSIANLSENAESVNLSNFL
ncbi:unnamed protein product [Caenorhabditis brenneri]